MRIHKGQLFVISAPSGTGKTTLCNRIIETIPCLEESVSFTTRTPRAGEVHDKDYSFISKERFFDMKDRNEFIEWAEVYGNYYGTSVNRIGGILSKGKDVLLDIDTQGAKQIKKYVKDLRSKIFNVIFIFILPPSLDALIDRLKKRNTERGVILQERLDKAQEEINEYKHYDYVILNDDLGQAIREFESIIISRRLKTENIKPDWIEKTYEK